jgi:hypothetical protein
MGIDDAQQSILNRIWPLSVLRRFGPAHIGCSLVVGDQYARIAGGAEGAGSNTG